MGSGVAAGEQKVAATQGHWPDSLLSQVVVCALPVRTFPADENPALRPSPAETTRSGAGDDKCAALFRHPRGAAARCQEFARLAEDHLPTFPSRPTVYPGELNSPHRGCPAYLMTTDSKSCLLGWSF